MKFSKEVILERIKMNNERQFNAFNRLVPKRYPQIFVDDNLWPEGITFRRFINFKKGKDSNNANHTLMYNG